jgi:subtilisin family serine protease
MRLLRRPELRIALLAVIGAVAWLTVRHSGTQETTATTSAPASWSGLVGTARPAVDLSGRYIVVLKTPSVAQRVARVQVATESAERRWTAEAFAAQQQVLTQLARHGLSIRPDYSFARVLDGFSGALDPRAVELLEHNPEVAGVYAVRAAYPASLSTARTIAASVPAAVPGLDGTGITIALLDTGVDSTHPFIRGRVLPGIDVVGGTSDTSAQHNPQQRRQVERHGTELAGVLVGAGGPRGVRGVAPGASVLPIRVAGWQPTATGRYAVYSRSDQLIAGLDRAVDPNADGDAHDALRIALVGVAEPFASFADGPEAQAVAGALTLDTLVVAPAGNDGAAGPLFGSVAGPAGAAGALVVGATDSRPATATVRVIFRQGLAVLADGSLPLLDTVAPNRPVSLPLAVPGQPGSLDGRVALVPAGANPSAQVSAAVGDGAAAVLVYGRRLPAGALTGFAVPVIGVDPSFAHATLQAVRRRYTVVATIGRSSTAPNGDAGKIASFSSRGLTYGGLLGPQLAAPGIAVATSEPGSAGDGEPDYGSVTGTSVAAAAVAGDAALLAQARPGLGAEELASLLTGSARPFGAAATAASGGTVDPGASVAGEVAASQTSLGFGPWNGTHWRELERFTVRDVSTRPLTLSLTSSSRLVTVEPATIDLRPGQSAFVRVTALATSRPALPIVSGTVTIRPAGVQALRIPWVIVFRPFTGSLLGGVRIDPPSFSPSDTKPATLTVVAGRIAGGRTLQIEPVGRLDVLLYTAGGRFLGELAKQRDLLPGIYRFGLTGRGPGGAALPAGSYEIRVVAQPVLPGPASKTKIAFRIQ